MSTTTLEQEYLRTSYRPDCDYVDGLLLERNVGQKDHSRIQGEVFAWFWNRRKKLGVAVFPEQRVAVKQGRYRVPDVSVVKLPEPDEQIFTKPPYICIEVLSPDDSFPKLQDRFDDYLKMGIANVWVIDPASRRAWTITSQGHLEALDGVLRSTDGVVALPISDLFEFE